MQKTYNVLYGKRKSAWFETFAEAEAFARANGGGLVYHGSSLVGNFTDKPTTGYADYVVGLKNTSWRNN